MTSLVAFIVP